MLKAAGYRILVDTGRGDSEVDFGAAGKFQIVGGDHVGIAATDVGIVVDMGPTAYKDVGDGTPWCKVGDTIVYGKYGGKIVTDPDTKKKFVVLNDQEVICIVKESDNG